VLPPPPHPPSAVLGAFSDLIVPNPLAGSRFPNGTRAGGLSLPSVRSAFLQRSLLRASVTHDAEDSGSLAPPPPPPTLNPPSAWTFCFFVFGVPPPRVFGGFVGVFVVLFLGLRLWFCVLCFLWGASDALGLKERPHVRSLDNSLLLDSVLGALAERFRQREEQPRIRRSISAIFLFFRRRRVFCVVPPSLWIFFPMLSVSAQCFSPPVRSHQRWTEKHKNTIRQIVKSQPRREVSMDYEKSRFQAREMRLPCHTPTAVSLSIRIYLRGLSAKRGPSNSPGSARIFAAAGQQVGLTKECPGSASRRGAGRADQRAAQGGAVPVVR